MGNYEILRNIVSDAVKIDLIGINSIDRMLMFNNLNDNKIDHSKILIDIVNKNYLNYKNIFTHLMLKKSLLH